MRRRDRSGVRFGGFTLIELVLALMIVVVLAGVAIPAMQGLSDERGARKPLDELSRMVQEVRTRAMLEQEAYQIVFDADGFYALRYFHPYGSRDDFKQLLVEMRQPPQSGDVVTPGVQRAAPAIPAASVAPVETGGGSGVPGEGKETLQSEMEQGRPQPQTVRRRDTYLLAYEKPADLSLSVLFWGDTAWQKAENDFFRRWVFQPTGLCNPLQVRVEKGENFFEVQFDPLTGEVTREKFYVPPER